MLLVGFSSRASAIGDVNGDGRVNVSDVSALINMILGTQSMNTTTGDVNGDSKVNVSDVSALINLILGTWSPDEQPEAGVYMGIIGFNQQLYTKPITKLDARNRQEYYDFIESLSPKNGTLLYWATDNALAMLENAPTPSNFQDVVLVTFTDGLDQGSLMMNSNFTTERQYLNSLKQRISGKIKNKPLKAYSVGLKGIDVVDELLFADNITNLASGIGKACVINNILALASEFIDVAEMVNSESYMQSLSFRVPGMSDGTKVRFTFDQGEMGDASMSQHYIEGTFNLSDRSLRNVQYVGLTSSSGATVQGVQDGIFVTFKFTNTKSEGMILPTDYIKQWIYIPSMNTWQRNSEFTPAENLLADIATNGVLIMLDLDCSSSLGSDFPIMQETAKTFIKILTDVMKNPSYTVNGVTFEIVPIDGGSFEMGSPTGDADESPRHNVTLSDYFLGKTPVTQELWQAVMGSNPSQFVNPKSPVDNVSWNDCQEFITKLNQMTGETFRLPTEAEWEYAARGGNKSAGYTYAGSNTVTGVAWCAENGDDTTHPVATKAPNELGLYDMTGNVWEWCQDNYGNNYYSTSPAVNPTGPASGSYKVRRGGCFESFATDCRNTNRDWYAPYYRKNINGLRLAR